MKYITILSLSIFTIFLLFFGQTYWSSQIEQTVALGNEKEQDKPKIEKKTSTSFENIKDADLKSALEKAVGKHEKANILIAGSKALGDQDGGMGKTLSKELQESFEQNVSVSFIDFDGTSNQLIKEGLISDYQDAKPDVLILESLTLADNGKIFDVKDSHENISMIIQELKSSNEDLYVILMPPHPIPSKYYPIQVDALKEYAAKKEITYIDHWKAWPDYKDEAELMRYLKKDKSAPNEKGIEIWSKEVLKLFGI